MDRARLAAAAALLIVLSLGGAAMAAQGGLVLSSAAVAWPPSTGLLVSEVQTGGASASDEFIEITNASSTSIDMSGLEVAYVTSTGGTVTRKGSWSSSLLLAPGRHLVLANSSGVYLPIADVTYSGGLAATGGAVVIRPIGGTAIDAVAWGDATNAFVEGTPAATPAASVSIERKPGGSAGNVTDTNSNALDFFVQAAPNPQNLGAPPAPAPAPTSTPAATAAATAAPSPTPSAAPSATATPSATTSPSETPVPTVEPTQAATNEPSIEPTQSPTSSPTPSAEPTPTPTPTPAPTLPPVATASPTSTPTPTEAPTPTPNPSPATTPIGTARLLGDGAAVTVIGTLTTRLGALDSARKGFVQDSSGGIAIYLDADVTDVVPAGTLVSVAGMLDDRYAERTLRARAADVVVLGPGTIPSGIAWPTGAVGEEIEGLRVVVEGVTSGTPTAYADGLGILVDDGSGQIRVIVGADALGSAVVPAGTRVRVSGPVGQHDSSGAGTSGYRIHATEPGDLELPAATPSPSPSPSATPGPSASAGPAATGGPIATPSSVPSVTPTPSPTPSPSPTPTPTPGVVAIHEARSRPAGTRVTVAGVVTAEAGRVGTPSLIAIQDSTAGILVRVPDGQAAPGRGAAVLVSGQLADPYGQLEIRPSVGSLVVTGVGVPPTARSIGAADLGEGTEASLVTLGGVPKGLPTKATSGDLSLDVTTATGAMFRVMADASSGIRPADLPAGRALRLSGIVGQRASRKDALDGYRVWLRDRADIVLSSAGTGTGSGGGTAGTGSGAGSVAALVSIHDALAAADGTTLTIEATVTADASLLDGSGRRIVVQDRSGAIEILLPVEHGRPLRVGGRIRATGEKSHAWGAPRIKATSVTVVSARAGEATVSDRGSSLDERDEWRLVRVKGTVEHLSRMGDRWRAEIRAANGDRIPILIQAAAGIPSTRAANGIEMTVIGIVKRPYPTATDRRFAILPRSSADIAGTMRGSGPSASAHGDGPGTAISGNEASSGPTNVTPDTDLATLFEHVGEVVKVGGLVSELTDDGFVLDDGTAVARVVLEGDARPLLGAIQPRDALAATGTVIQDGEDLRIRVASAADLVRVGDLGEALPVASGGHESFRSGLESAGPEHVAVAGTLGPAPAELSVAAILGLSLVSLSVTLLRRRHAALRSRAIVVRRLARLRGPEASQSVAPPPASASASAAASTNRA